MWCVPPDQDAEFACAMENVLDVYVRPSDAKRPVVCFEEKSKQLVAETIGNESARGNRLATRTRSESTGSSRPPTRESNYGVFTRRF